MSKIRFRTATLVTIGAVLMAGCGTGGTVAEVEQTSPSATESAQPTEVEDQTTEVDEQTTAPMEMDDPTDGAPQATASEQSTSMDDMDMAMAGDFGEPADPDDATRTVEVSLSNDLAFEPATFDAEVGDVITFTITNTGDIEHEFVLGDEAAQQQMGEEMASGEDHGHAGDMTNAVTIHGGETAELTWRFTTPGTVLIGCHVPGHWEGGMRGEVVVAG